MEEKRDVKEFVLDLMKDYGAFIAKLESTDADLSMFEGKELDNKLEEIKTDREARLNKTENALVNYLNDKENFKDAELVAKFSYRTDDLTGNVEPKTITMFLSDVVEHGINLPDDVTMYATEVRIMLANNKDYRIYNINRFLYNRMIIKSDFKDEIKKDANLISKMLNEYYMAKNSDVYVKRENARYNEMVRLEAKRVNIVAQTTNSEGENVASIITIE